MKGSDDLYTLRLLAGTLVHPKAIQLTSERRVLRSDGLNHSKSMCVLMFLHHLRLNLSYPFFLRIRRVPSTLVSSLSPLVFFLANI